MDETIEQFEKDLHSEKGLDVLKERINNYYVSLTHIKDLNKLRRRYDPEFLHSDEFESDIFVRTINGFLWDELDAKKLFKLFDIFVENGEVFKNFRIMMSVFTTMFAKSELSFYIIVASYIDKKTWRNIYEESRELLRAYPDYEEIAIIGLYSCVKLVPFFFTQREVLWMEDKVLTTFGTLENPAFPERHIFYGRKLDVNGQIDGERIQVQNGRESLESGDIAPEYWDTIWLLADVNPFEFSERQIDNGPTHTERDNASLDFIYKEMMRRFEEAKKRLLRRKCVDEVIEYMLGVIPLGLPVYINYEIAYFTLDCVREGIVTQFHVMRIVQRVVNALRNARAHNENLSKK